MCPFIGLYVISSIRYFIRPFVCQSCLFFGRPMFILCCPSVLCVHPFDWQLLICVYRCNEQLKRKRGRDMGRDRRGKGAGGGGGGGEGTEIKMTDHWLPWCMDVRGHIDWQKDIGYRERCIFFSVASHQNVKIYGKKYLMACAMKILLLERDVVRN